MAITTKVHGSNIFLFATIGGTKKLVGSTTKFDTGVTGTPIDISSVESGLNKEYLPASMMDTDVSFDGIYKVYTSGDLTAKAQVDDFYAALKTGVTVEIYKGAAITTGSVVDKGTLVISSAKETHLMADKSTYSVAGKISGGWAPVTLP